MEKITLTTEASVALGIKGEATDAAVSTGIVALEGARAAEKARADGLQAKLDAHASASAQALVDAAVAAGKITADRKESFITLAKSNYDLAKATLDAIQAKVSLADAVKGIKGDGGVIPADRASWTRLKWLKEDPEGLAKLKAEHPEAFEAVCKIHK